jgi:ubiquinone/menaquinone biosynthesis C-methylase UbiE
MNTLPAWFYNDLQQVGVDFEDTAQVAAFDRNQKSSTVEAEQGLIKYLGICAGHTVIDFGAGTGTFAIEAALAGAYVYAVDVSNAMLALAGQKAHNANVDNIDFHHAGFLTYEHKAEPVDFVVTKAALHHLPDFWKMVAFLQMAAILKDGGVLYLRDVIFSFPPTEYQTYIDAWIERAAKPLGEGFTTSDFEMHVREHSSFAWIIEGMLSKVGFKIETVDYLSPTIAQYVCRKMSR